MHLAAKERRLEVGTAQTFASKGVRPDQILAQAIVALLAAAPHEMNPQLFSTNVHGQTPFDVAVEARASEEVLDVLKGACSKLLLNTAATAKDLGVQVSVWWCRSACLLAAYLCTHVTVLPTYNLGM